jgi:hypothetical protein
MPHFYGLEVVQLGTSQALALSSMQFLQTLKERAVEHLWEFFFRFYFSILLTQYLAFTTTIILGQS